MKFYLYAAGIVMGLHGLVHLMGFVAYWPLAKLTELPYKTSLLDGRWEIGSIGMKIYGVLWLLAAVGFVLCAAGLLTHQAWLNPLLIVTLLLSTAVIILDWAPAFRGGIINAVILVIMGLTYAFPSLLAAR